MVHRFASSQLMPGAEAFQFDAPGPVGCVLVHGFTGTANEIRDLGSYLAGEGFSVRGILLSGHGTSPEDMARFSYRDWIADVEIVLDELLAEGKRVFLCGLSMGGTLVLNVAARRRDQEGVRGVVALAAPMRLTDWRLPFLPVARLFLRWHRWTRPDIKDDTQWERHVSYRRFHVRALAQLLALMRETRRLAPHITQPLLVVHSRFDNTVPPSNAELIIRLASSHEKRLVWLENCFHVVTLDYEAERVRQEVLRFINQHSNG